MRFDTIDSIPMSQAHGIPLSRRTMSRRTAIILWAAAAWVTPALVAGALGWTGIWGSGSAFGDYLVPVPVAGGALHVPSFVVTLVLVAAWPRLADGTAALIRGGVCGVALLGVALLIDVGHLAQVVTTDLPFTRVRWEENPLGLFLASDGLWLLAWTLGRPAIGVRRLPALGLAMVIPVSYLLVGPAALPEAREPFLWGRHVPAPGPADAAQLVFTRLAVDDPTFRRRARAFIGDRGPTGNVNAEDMAFLFTDSLESARALGDREPLVTLCLYQDGTPERWLPGRGNCFGDHQTFRDLLNEVGSRLPRSLPGDVRSFLIVRELCTARLEPVRAAASPHDEFCGDRDLGPLQDELASRYPVSRLEEWGIPITGP